MTRPYLITAIGTPLTDQEALHHEGLAAHLSAQAESAIDGILVAGSMGLMQLLSDSTYLSLVERSVEHWRGKGEILVGVGDTSYVRTRDRIQQVNEFPVDGTVALAPYFINFSQEELVDYYRALAAESKAPLYLYDLPPRTGTRLDVKTVRLLADHPNIAGIKCSGDTSQTRRLLLALGDHDFRVIVAKPALLDVLYRGGIREHLDGVFGIAPRWMKEIADSLQREDWQGASQSVQKLVELQDVVVRYGIYSPMTALLNAQGVLGNFAPRPYAALSDTHREEMLQEPIVVRLLDGG